MMSRIAAIATAWTVSIVLPSAAGAQMLEPRARVHVTRAGVEAGVPKNTTRTEVGLSSAFPIAPRAGAGLIIQPTFDSSITGNVNAVAIENAINAAISVLQANFKDPITVSVYFRYSTTQPGGSALAFGSLAQSDYVTYEIPWATFVSALTADASTTNDAAAVPHLPASPMTTNISASSANGRAVGLNTPGAIDTSGNIGASGTYDGIVTINASQNYSFTRPAASDAYDAQRTIEHELDEVLGLGSSSNSGQSDYRPQDLFMYKAPGAWSVVLSDPRYFSVDGGATQIIDFNQDSNGDSGDWLSGPCPQTSPFVQNAFGCMGQFSDVSATSPEGVNLDVIGYDLVAGTPSNTTRRRAVHH